jgi:hypothetical protein
MAETMVTDPVYLDQTAKDNGRKLDQMTAALLGMSSSLGVIARAQTGVVEEMDYNGINNIGDNGKNQNSLWTLAAPRLPSPPAPSW